MALVDMGRSGGQLAVGTATAAVAAVVVYIPPVAAMSVADNVSLAAVEPDRLVGVQVLATATD